ncbi:phosphoadenosine phosphosulfate reductase [Runella defluvii]|uniref:Adenosine 5'-phosphosulfate reductase n=1 Tax=Runella defluvii TaxID=370973 RepID=A0A7W5ZL32_9BACT|nr:phosphoadenylyl-sulfate reductase [Runella defluvii]MBB3839031.1 phosphoadenosine phosphosulfate reductase [Runella defluvii]
MTSTETHSTESLLDQIEGKTEVEILRLLSELFPGQVAFSSSLGYEDQVITDMILANGIDIRIFTLDTGRMFPESYTTLQKTNNRYDTKLEVFFPQSAGVEKLLTEKGPLSFYESVENRKECCFIRKVEPLNRALKGVKVWVTGIRAEQSNNRTGMQAIEWDGGHELFKYNPLLAWSFDEVKQYVKAHNVPYNPLHDKGFVSIGCAPCTRAILEGEDFRAGRWWWEDESKKECGLHAR